VNSPSGGCSTFKPDPLRPLLDLAEQPGVGGRRGAMLTLDAKRAIGQVLSALESVNRVQTDPTPFDTTAAVDEFSVSLD
jgi:hypothetical protein